MVVKSSIICEVEKDIKFIDESNDHLIKILNKLIKDKYDKYNNLLNKNKQKINNLKLLLQKDKNNLTKKENIDRNSFINKNENIIINLQAEKCKYKNIFNQVNIRKNENELINEKINKFNQMIIDKNIEIKNNKIKFEKQKQDDLEEEIKTKNILKYKEKILKKIKIKNEIYQNNKGNIRVFLRVKPILTINSNKNHLIDDYDFVIKNRKQLNLNFSKKNNFKNIQKKYEFNFEQIYNEQDNQKQIFNDLKFLIGSIIQGSKVNIFAYGATGSGKSYTILGGSNNKTIGITPRSIQYLFQNKKDYEKLDYKIEFNLKIVEIYLNKVKNLIDEFEILEINKNRKNIHNLKYDKDKDNIIQVKIENYEDAMILYNTASKNRSNAVTFKNNNSSRSHFIFNLEAKIITNKSEVNIGNLILTDLAGSEKHDQNASSKIQEESKSINMSLTNLSLVINEIKNNYNHISVRNNKLTDYLHNYLTKGKVLMFINISNDSFEINNIISSLNFGENVQNCKIDINSKRKVR